MITQQLLSVDEMVLVEHVANAITPALRRPLPVMLWADTGAQAFQRGRLGSATVIALNSSYAAFHRAEQAELIYSALLWAYRADERSIKAPPASRVSSLSRAECWSSDLPQYLADWYSTMPACEHCTKPIFTGRPHKACHAFQSKMEERIAKLEKQLAEARRAQAALEATTDA